MSLLITFGTLSQCLASNSPDFVKTAEKGDLAKMKLEFGADVNVRTTKGWTALKWATSSDFGCSAAVPILQAAGAVK